MILEAVPNFSEGRRDDVCRAIADAADGRGARVADLHVDADHNRCVLTLIGGPDALLAAALAAARKAVDAVDLNGHEGIHPRMGAVDVLPFVPLREAAMDDAVALARRAGEALGKEGLPVFLYGEASARPDRRNLAEIRHPRFEGLRDLVGKDPRWTPDFGPDRVHPTAGCTAVGARGPLVAYNLDLETNDPAVARRIARKIRERDGGLPGIKALGMLHASRGCAHVSVNVCDPARTRLLDVFRAVEREAPVRSSEIVGLVPEAALPENPAEVLRLREWDEGRILERNLR